MFNKENFSSILREINSTYSSMTEFAQKASFDRTYISKYINMKLSNPPTPKILDKIANASNGVATYEELMHVCGYYTSDVLLGEFFERSFIELLKKLTEHNISLNSAMALHDILKFPSETSEKEFNTALDEVFSNLSQEEYLIVNNVINEFIEKQINFANSLKSSMNTLLQNKKEELSKGVSKNLYNCPVYGRISAGQPNWAEECLEGYLPIDPNLMGIIAPEEHFFLRVNGESMNKVIRNGAYALIHKQDIVENGEIAVVLVNGDEATLKKFSKQEDLVILEPMSDDSSFQVQVYNKTTPINILGKYVGKFEINK